MLQVEEAIMQGHDILNNPFLNKGTAFTAEERRELGLVGKRPITKYIEKGSKVLSTLDPFSIYKLS